MKIGYARVSTQDQCLDLQLRALEQAGCEKVYKDHGVSGLCWERPGLSAALECVRAGDTLVVWRLDRFGRSMQELLAGIEKLNRRRVGFCSLSEHIDIDTAFGELILHVLGAVVHFERRLIVERTKEGMAAAKERGAHVGRPAKCSAEDLYDIRDALKSGRDPQCVAQAYRMSETVMMKRLEDQFGVKPTFDVTLCE